MAKVKVKALDAFSHGRLNTRPGETYTMSTGDAEDLEKLGLVKIEGEAADEEVDDLVGDGKKMAPLTSNKMEAKHENKGAKK